MVITEKHIKTLAARLAKKSGLPLNQVQGEIAQALGFKNWNGLSAKPTPKGDPDEIVAKIIAAASSHYDDDLIAQTYDAKTNTVLRDKVGDTLAEFIAIEISEVAEGSKTFEDGREAAIHALENAYAQLERVIGGLERTPPGGKYQTLHECQDTGEFWTEGQLREIKHFHERVAPGEAVPSGESPTSGCLTHEVTIPDPSGIIEHAMKIADELSERTGKPVAILLENSRYNPVLKTSCRNIAVTPDLTTFEATVKLTSKI